MKRSTIFFLWILMVTAAWAQRTVVSGTVVDEATGKPVAGASVTAEGLSVVTNEDGFFTLKSDRETADITVSHIGYRSQRVKLQRLEASSTNKVEMKVLLKPVAIQLKEVLVMADDPRELVLAAIGRIPANYSRQPELYRCFYREKAMKRQHYISVAEGVTDMYKTGYQRGLGRDRVAISKGRRLLSAKQSDTLGVKVMGGPVTPIELDLVKNNDFLLNAKELDLYDLKMEVPTTIADRQQYVVSLVPRAVMPYALYRGRLYIDCETLAFTRAELSLDMSDRDKATAVMLVRKPKGLRFRPKELSLVVDYRRGSDGLTRMSYLSTTFRFNCDWRRHLFATSFAAFCEMAVTSVSSEDVQPIRGRDSFDQRDAFFDRVDFFRDPAFWQDYNIIEPSESLDKAVDRLLRRSLPR